MTDNVHLVAGGTTITELGVVAPSLLGYGASKLRLYFDAYVSDEIFQSIAASMHDIDLLKPIREDMGVVVIDFMNEENTLQRLSAKEELLPAVGWQIFTYASSSVGSSVVLAGATAVVVLMLLKVKK
jgi:ABC-type sugar transport system permease subunit